MNKDKQITLDKETALQLLEYLKYEYVSRNKYPLIYKLINDIHVVYYGK